MWQCPKCKREFENSIQDHYCDKIETIDQIADIATRRVNVVQSSSERAAGR